MQIRRQTPNPRRAEMGLHPLPLCTNVRIKSATTGTGFRIILPAMGNTLEENAVVKYQILCTEIQKLD